MINPIAPPDEIENPRFFIPARSGGSSIVTGLPMASAAV